MESIVMTKKGFEILFVSETQYEHLAAEILFDGQRLCQINKENGNNSMEIEFLKDLYIVEKDVTMKFSLLEFEKILNVAKEELKLCS
jgi:hypothetical protein